MDRTKLECICRIFTEHPVYHACTIFNEINLVNAKSISRKKHIIFYINGEILHNILFLSSENVENPLPITTSRRILFYSRGLVVEQNLERALCILFSTGCCLNWSAGDSLYVLYRCIHVNDFYIRRKHECPREQRTETAAHKIISA